MYNQHMRKTPAKPSMLRVGGIIVPTGSHEGKNIHIGADHRGFRLKEWLKKALRRRGWKVVDEGTHSPARTDYPIWMAKVARAVGRSTGRKTAGIGICGSGIGACIPAAKINGVHPALCRTIASARETRTHNNTNFLSLASDFTSPAEALKIAETWLKTPFYTDSGRDAPYLRRFLQTARLERRGR
jgi:ribose 5-phosphate isomerase B